MSLVHEDFRTAHLSSIPHVVLLSCQIWNQRGGGGSSMLKSGFLIEKVTLF
jgi:hypothetical protein